VNEYEPNSKELSLDKALPTSAKHLVIPPETSEYSESSEKIIKYLKNKLFTVEQKNSFCSKTIAELNKTTSEFDIQKRFSESLSEWV
jgi:hypothetical protein